MDYHVQFRFSDVHAGWLYVRDMCLVQWSRRGDLCADSIAGDTCDLPPPTCVLCAQGEGPLPLSELA